MSKTKTTSKKDGKKPHLTIMVPVYNEEKTLLKILNGVTSLEIDSYEVIVVNDGSKDKSPLIIEKFSSEFKSPNVKLRVINHSKNRGKGAGIKTGIKHAQGAYFVIQDADLEYDPKDIPPLLKAAMKHDKDAVYGSRFKGKMSGMPKPNYYANKFYNVLLRRLYDTQITDMHTCYKMVRTPLIRELNMTSEGFGYATELVSKLLKRGIDIHEEPVSFKGRTKSEGKKINYKDGIECTYGLIRYKFSKKI